MGGGVVLSMLIFFSILHSRVHLIKFVLSYPSKVKPSALPSQRNFNPKPTDEV